MSRTSSRAIALAGAAALAAGGVAGSVALAEGPSPKAAPIAHEKAGGKGKGPVSADPDFAQVGRYQVDFAIPEDASAAETFAIDRDRMYVTNAANGTLDIVDISRPDAPVLLERITLGAAPNSVDAGRTLVAVALDATPKTDPGTVRFFQRTRDGLRMLRDVTVGAVPDMVLFTDDGRKLLVANEGEPSGYGDEGVDPEGSVSIIDARGVERGAPAVRTVGFRAFDEGGPRHDELPDGLRLNGPGARVSQDLEPEYIALSATGRDAYVSLQENNALAVIDVRRARVSRIIPMGLRDHSQPGAGIDASNRDDAINIAPWPVVGIPMPDGIDAFRLKGQDYVITANEGDAREWGSFADVDRLRDATLDGANLQVPGFDGADLAENENLGRLNISLTDGFDGPVLRRPHSFGSRSVSILRPDGTLVWDSGDAFEQVTAAERPDIFNASNSNNEFDNRSDDKGPEPEDVAVGTINGRTYAFVALERVGGLMVLDITDPARGRVVRWVNTRDYTADPTATDSGPEIVKFIPRSQSPTRKPLVVFSNEVSGSIVFLQPTG
ncbi:MAG: choice-of-anchor I family protein [Miltoncostaeaceae bacterium]